MTGRPKGIVPKKGQKLIDGVWVTPAEVETVLWGTATEPTSTTTNAQSSVTLTHHEMVHPRKGMSAYERRNWMNARAGWPQRGGAR